MKFRTIGYALLIGAAAVALSIGAADAKYRHKKKAGAPPQPQPQICLYEATSPVCGSLKGHKFTYANRCAAWKDGATIVSWKACPVKKAVKHKKKRYHAKKKAAKKKY